MSFGIPPETTNLLLCEYAQVRDGKVNMLGAGLDLMPRNGQWFLAGTIDATPCNLAHGITIQLYETMVGLMDWVDPLHIPVEHPEISDQLDSECPLRVPVAIALPNYESVNSYYLLGVEIGTLSTSLPFLIEHNPDLPSTFEIKGRRYEEAQKTTGG